MSRLRVILVLAILAGPAAAEWQPDASDERQRQAAVTLDAIRTAGGEEFETLFADAYAFAIFPRLVRNGLLLGWASGTGILVEDAVFSGLVRQRRFSLGFQIGRQTQGQVLLFKDRETVDTFKAGGLEFTPQASAHAKKQRRAKEASFRPSVAVFSLSNDGVMVEAAVGTTAFRFMPPP